MKMANTKPITIAVLIPNSITALSNSACDFPEASVIDAPTVRMCLTAAITPIMRKFCNWKTPSVYLATTVLRISRMMMINNMSLMAWIIPVGKNGVVSNTLTTEK